MANAMYDAGREDFLAGDNDWDLDHRVVVHDDADDTVNLAVDDFLDDVAAAARVAVSGALQNPTTTAGTADADDITISSVSGDEAERLIIYQHTGVDSTSPLVLSIDTATGLPFTPNGGDLTITWDGGADRIFTL